MGLFKNPVAVILPPSAVNRWKQMYGPSYEHKGDRAKTLADAFYDDEEDDDDDEGDDEEPEEFPEEYPDEEP